MLKSAEKLIGDLLKGLPNLPESARKALAQWWPVLALIGGILQVWGAWGLWNLSRGVSRLYEGLSDYSRALGIDNPAPDIGAFYWLSLLVLLASGIILLAAYPGLKSQSKSKGWDYVFFGALVNLAYGVLILFVDSYYGGGMGRLFGTLVGSAIGFYLLFQVRSQYKDGRGAAVAESKKPDKPAE